MPGRAIVVDAVRVVTGPAPMPAPRSPVERWIVRDGAAVAWCGTPTPGPTVLAEPGATVVVEPGWTVRPQPSGAVLLEHAGGATLQTMPPEVVSARCVSIAEWMSATLQCTARSPNVRDRLDYSCGLLDAQGVLCANAPNVPVHLGALGACDAAVQRTVVRPVRAPLGDGRALCDAITAARVQAGLDADDPASARARIDAIVRIDGQSGTFEVEVTSGEAPPELVAACTQGVVRRHQAMFGRPMPGRAIVVDAVRVVTGVAPMPAPRSPVERWIVRDGAAVAWSGTPTPGPAVLAEPGATIVVEPGWTVRPQPSGAMLLEHAGGATPQAMPPEVVSARCVSIAEWMSATLQRTARSP
ncbi:MAG: hydantoinase B/oxoprolinase family protein, partial [Phycisphaerales bacterium]